MLAFNQGGTRRGSYAAYTDISHPEIEEWIGMRKASGGDINSKTLNLNHAVNITDDFMEASVMTRRGTLSIRIRVR
jgi:ribonucleoside-diphosphate reductase alpha chain